MRCPTCIHPEGYDRLSGLCPTCGGEGVVPPGGAPMTDEKGPTETRARKRIREAVESRGYSVLSIEWEPWGSAAEMSGIPGGWTVTTDAPWHPNTNYGNEACGLSVEEVLADIDWTIRPTEPCGCYPEDRNRHPLVSIKGDPEHPLHEPGCRWFIDYRLGWWKRPLSPASEVSDV